MPSGAGLRPLQAPRRPANYLCQDFNTLGKAQTRARRERPSGQTSSEANIDERALTQDTPTRGAGLVVAGATHLVSNFLHLFVADLGNL